MTFSWLGFNAIILTHLLELTFEFSPFAKDNKLRMGIRCQPRFRIGLDHLVAGSIIVRASQECVLSGVFIVQGPTRSTQTMTHFSDPAVLGGKRPYFLRSFLDH
jgi:hypothetical protein